MNETKNTGLVFSHCHWDIEWYMPFRSFRFWLIELLDRLIEICDQDPEYKTYVLDGQVAPLEHYLEVRPENEARIRELIESGRLSIGPFYTQFDEWLISGESIVRNCLYGMTRAHEFKADVMRAGYLPDNFGHPKQMPQILAGFGIDSLIFQRGLPPKTDGLPDEFYWEGLDGTRTLALHLIGYYGNAFPLGAGDNEFAKTLLRVSPYRDNHFGFECLTAMTGQCDVEAGAEKLIAQAEKFLPGHPSGVVPLGNGTDHAPPQTQLTEIIKRANTMQDDILFVHGNCQDLAEMTRERAGQLPVYSGDLWGAGYQYILTGTLSTRTYIKQQNFIAENLLEKYVEPLACAATLQGAPYPDIQLEEAWRLMFINHSHDSIHGSSVDAVHLEMMQRYAGVRQIANGLCHESLKYLAGLLARPAEKNAIPILAYNPVETGCAASIVDMWIVSPSPDFHIVDNRGQMVPFQVIEGHDDGAYIDDQTRHVLISTPVPSMGYESLSCLPGRKEQPAGSFSNNDNRIENEFLRVEFRDGLLDVHDKVSGHDYKGLNIIEDEADAGDAWDFSPPRREASILTSTGFASECRLVEDGPVRSTIQIETAMRLPSCLEGDDRSAVMVAVPLTARISLYRDARYVAVDLCLDNQARDHRLRLKCPTGIVGQSVKSQGHFGIIDRPIRNPHTPEGWLQPPPQTFHFRDWVAADDGKHGLAVACRGLYEYESRNGPSGVDLYITLLRGIGLMAKPDLLYRKDAASERHFIPGAQCSGLQRFEYAFVPYNCEPQSRAPFRAAANSFLCPAMGHQVAPGEHAPTGEEQTTHLSAFSPVQPDNLVVSCFKRAVDGSGFILRLWENEGRETEAELAVDARFDRAFRCRLNEDSIEEIKLTGSSGPEGPNATGQRVLSFRVKPYQIITVKLRGAVA